MESNSDKSLVTNILQSKVKRNLIFDSEANSFTSKKSSSIEGYREIVVGLLYGIVTCKEERQKYFEQVTFIVRDGFESFVTVLQILVTEKFHLLLDECIQNVIYKNQDIFSIK